MADTSNNTNTLVWNVYRYNINSGYIETMNIFKHGVFFDDLIKLKKEYKAWQKKLLSSPEYTESPKKMAAEVKKFKETTFASKLDSTLRYCFWSRSEYEVIVTSWPPRVSPANAQKLNNSVEEHPNWYSYALDLDVEEKIDIYDQIKNNWDIFVNYVWDNIDLIGRKVRT